MVIAVVVMAVAKAVVVMAVAVAKAVVVMAVAAAMAVAVVMVAAVAMAVVMVAAMAMAVDMVTNHKDGVKDLLSVGLRLHRHPYRLYCAHCLGSASQIRS